mgnify:CR=1 FL=1
MSIRVSIDASGGDFGFSVTINAGINALKTYDDLLINFVGDEAGIKNELNKNSSYSNFADRIFFAISPNVLAQKTIKPKQKAWLRQ